MASPVYFGAFVVTSQVFYRTTYSFALVNLKPLLPGHVLVCPKRVVPRLRDLKPEEVTDLFLTVQKVLRVFEGVYKAHGFNVAIQDGLAAGQSVPHVHAHIIPRRFQDLPDSDDIYSLIESDAGDLALGFQERDTPPKPRKTERAKFPTPLPDALRLPRSEQVMREEAEMLAKEMENWEASTAGEQDVD
ncbi:HIT-like domain-containing protein [Peziza echinospora]|nr:HIT-like domain-containing protein [Peziza echinospora]